jgi:hypothetical protein
MSDPNPIYTQLLAERQAAEPAEPESAQDTAQHEVSV